jgi:hypothetical protein
MLTKEAKHVQISNFNLKNEQVELVGPQHSSERAVFAISDLESMRTARLAIPASKHGLETICGASCETGAQ